jgi:diadenosine tetraphosphatase ApaH/serine/threonine PP2A family protein phosphatase
LKDLPYLHHAHGAVFAHAVFDFPNSWEYVVSPRQARRCFDTFQAPMLFLGHVHVPCLYAAGPTRSVEEITPQAGHGYTPAPGCRYLVNVGSVGQPRDGDNAAAFVMYDSEAPSITFHRVPYDFPHTARKIRQAGLHDFYAERLASGQ